jgi:hypothetical protein
MQHLPLQAGARKSCPDITRAGDPASYPARWLVQRWGLSESLAATVATLAALGERP